MKIFKHLVKKKQKKCKIPEHIIIGDNTILLGNVNFRFDVNSKNKVTIGNDCMLNCNFIFESDKGEIEIGDRVFIIIGAKSVVRDNIPPWTIVTGNPAKPIKTLKREGV